MATDRQTAANRANAAHSTGPRTPAGKQVARFNRLTHGLDSPAPVVPGERAEDWAAYRDGLVRSLAPVGPLEVELADRAALLFWRLRRVARYEAAATTAAFDQAVGTLTGEGVPGPPPGSVAGLRDRLAEHRAELDHRSACAALVRDLPGLPDDHPLPGPTPGLVLAGVAEDECPEVSSAAGVLADLDLPDDAWDDLVGWGGWTPRTVRAGLAEVARRAGQTPAQILARAGRRLDREAAEQQGEATRAEEALARAEADLAAAVDRARELNAIPTAATDKVIRYEAHLSRQLNQTLQLLDRFQAARVAGRLQPAEADGWAPGPMLPDGRGDESANRTQLPAHSPAAAVAGPSTPGEEAAGIADRTQPVTPGTPAAAAGTPAAAPRPDGSADRTQFRSVAPAVGAAGRRPGVARGADSADRSQLDELIALLAGSGPLTGWPNGHRGPVR